MKVEGWERSTEDVARWYSTYLYKALGLTPKIAKEKTKKDWDGKCEVRIDDAHL